MKFGSSIFCLVLLMALATSASPLKENKCKDLDCEDLCLEACAPDAECKVEGNSPICSCPQNPNSNPFVRCSPLADTEIKSSPMKDDNVQKCLKSQDCDLDRTCINSKCQDPCIGVCGRNTGCVVVNHAPVCSCLPNHTGDPFLECSRIFACS